MKPEISILMPVYNVEKRLKKCIESILKQSFQNWELIAVNDCSPDNSREILSRYEEIDNRIKIVDHPVNRGVSQSRFTGLDHAQGKYVVFIDSDDWMPKNALKLLYHKIEEEEADIVIGSMSKVLDKYGIIKTKQKNIISPENRTEIITMPELFDKYFISYFGVSLLLFNMWGRIYRRATINKIPLEPVPFFFGEDLIFNMSLHPFLSKIGFVTDRVYFYRQGGNTCVSTPYLLPSIKKLFYIRKEHIRKYNYNKALPYLKVELINCFYSHFQNLVLLDRKSFTEVRILMEEELKDSFYNELLFEGITQSERSHALKSKNIDKILTIIRKSVRNAKPKHLLIRFIARMLG